MQLGETIATYDVALALRGENGKFDVTTPTGETYHVTCKPGHSITNLEWCGNGGNPQPFVIRKVSEPVLAVPEKTVPQAAQTPAQPSVPKAPFLISYDEEDDLLSERSAPISIAPQPEPARASSEIFDLDLVYQESAVPAACVILRSESVRDRLKLTNACGTFNQFDAEIRRLHAQLDDIRYRARKKFYQANEMAPGA